MVGRLESLTRTCSGEDGREGVERVGVNPSSMGVRNRDLCVGVRSSSLERMAKLRVSFSAVDMTLGSWQRSRESWLLFILCSGEIIAGGSRGWK